MKKLEISSCVRYLRYIAFALLLYPLSVLGAQGHLAVKGQSMSIKQMMQIIEKNSDYTFFYDDTDLTKMPNKDINCSGTVKDVLDKVFENSGISYVIKGKEIILRVEKQAPLQQKRRTVTGTVTDVVDGTPIIGANILVKGENTGVITDIDGNFSISIPVKKGTVLVVSYIGFKKREVPVEDLGVINIKLESDNEVLDEVVIVGSGTQKKVSITGAITSVKGMELKAPSSSLTNSFAGKLAGVIATTTSGEPGASSDFYIRGIATFGGRATPLIMLDDVEISSGDLNNIPAETIESFSILKDASATAIYGARGANGVMLITTKRGQENTKARINITVENSFSSPVRFPKFADGATWMEMYNEAQLTRTPGSTPKYSQEQIDGTRNHLNPYVYPDVDWSDLIFKNMSMNQRANINLSGGGSKVTYYMSLNVNHDTGLLDSPKLYSWNNNINNLKYNFQNNISYKVTSSTKIDLNMNAQIGNLKGPNFSSTDLFQMNLTANPINFPAYYPQEGEEHMRFGNNYITGTSYRINPYAFMATSFKQTDESTLNTTLKIDQQLEFITKGLSVNALVNFKSFSTTAYARSIEPYYYRVASGSYDPTNPTTYELERLGTSGTDYISEGDIIKNSDRTITLQFQLNYQRQFGLHNLGGMLMYMQRDYKETYYNNLLPKRNQGLSGRLTYDYGQRYLFEFNFGYNGTERLAKGNRFEFFPAASIGWVVSNEPFFESLRNKIDNLKVRASYGLVGSDETGLIAESPHFLYIDSFSLNSVGFTTGENWNTTKSGPYVNQYGVVNGGWERSRKLDIGLDITLFKNWNITTDYFYERRYNILVHREAWPESLGYYSAKPWRNMGEVSNWGFEFSSSYHQQITKDLSMDIRGNFTYTQNRYENLDEPVYPYNWQISTGHSLAASYGYIAEGLFQSQEEIDNSPVQNLGSTPQPGDIKYRDLNGDGVIDSYDSSLISEYGSTPRIQYGIGVNLKYKNFDLGVFFNGSAMRKISVKDIHPFGEGDRNIFQFIADDYWTEANPNPDAKYPRLGLTNGSVANNQQTSTYWMRNGNFVRFKTLEVGYRFKYGRIYLNGDNIAIFSPFKEWDPELEWYKYPLQRTFNIGLQLNF